MKPLCFSSLRRSTLTGLRFATLALLIGSLPTACSKKEDATPQVGCKITSRTYQGSGNPSTNTWEYGTDGLLKSVTSSGGGKTNYTYDGNGYLTTTTYLNATGTVTSTEQVEFTNGRLTKVISKNAGGTISSTSQYEYDGAGSLTKITEQNVGGGTYTYSYSGGKQTGYIIKSSSGVESQPYTFENGLVKRYTSGTSQANFEYDAQGRRTRYETLSSGKVTSYTVYEYTDGTSVTRAYPMFKGISDLVTYGTIQTGDDIGLETKETSYIISSTNVTSKYSETTTSYIKNTTGLPTEANEVIRYYNATGGVTTTSAYKYTYSYTGCQ